MLSTNQQKTAAAEQGNRRAVLGTSSPRERRWAAGRRAEGAGRDRQRWAENGGQTPCEPVSQGPASLGQRLQSPDLAIPVAEATAPEEVSRGRS